MTTPDQKTFGGCCICLGITLVSGAVVASAWLYFGPTAGMITAALVAGIVILLLGIAV